MIPLVRLLVIITMYMLSLLYIESKLGVGVMPVFATLFSAALVFLIFPCITKTRD